MRASVLAVLITGMALLAAAVPSSAHHSFAAEFDATKPMTLRGTLTKMEWVNPHGWFHMDVTEPDGTVVTWMIQAGSPTAMLRRGFRKTDFLPGMELIVEGFRGRSGKTIAFGKSVKLPDGRELFSGLMGGQPGSAK